MRYIVSNKNTVELMFVWEVIVKIPMIYSFEQPQRSALYQPKGQRVSFDLTMSALLQVK